MGNHPMKSKYELTWITPNLAVGYAPMSYEDLEVIKKAGITAIVNLCGEYCDLHEIEEKAGFDVYYLPIPDEHAPDLEAMERALEWLDEAIFLGKKVLVHCKHGIGRTGTFVTAYLIRKGLGYKEASRKMKDTRSNPSCWSQWRLLKKYEKHEKPLKIREPSLESRGGVDLSVYFSKYEKILETVDLKTRDKTVSKCGKEDTACCREYFELYFLEALYLHTLVNQQLRLRARKQLIERANALLKRERELKAGLPADSDDYLAAVTALYSEKGLVCPLLDNERCMLFDFRPARCRTYKTGIDNNYLEKIYDLIFDISRMLFFALSGKFLKRGKLQFSCAEVISGRFMETYFRYASKMDLKGSDPDILSVT